MVWKNFVFWWRYEGSKLKIFPHKHCMWKILVFFAQVQNWPKFRVLQ